MKNEWLKNGQSIIRISSIVAVHKDMYNGMPAIRIDTNVPSTMYNTYDNKEIRNEEFNACCELIYDEPTPAKPHDYDKVKESIKKIFALYGGKDTLSSTQIRNAMVSKVDDIDWCGYGMPELYMKAVEYGILSRVSRQMFKLEE